jgi:hypothetical protein
MRVALTHLTGGQTLKIVRVREVAVTGVTSLTVKLIVDNPVAKIHKVHIDGLSSPIVLWEGADYEAMSGNFTHSEIQTRLQQIAAKGDISLEADNGK